MGNGVWRSAFSKTTGVVARIMSRRNPSNSSASSPNVEEKNFDFFLLMLDAQKRPL